jgi:cation transport regulator ChaC
VIDLDAVMICGKSFAVQLTSFIFLTKLCRGIVTTRTPSSSLKQLTFTRTKPRRRTGHTMSDWDAENGVWLGDRATSDDQLPSPLYLFGYGSLLWRPGDLLGNFTSSSCSCDNWQRLFAQRSSDHRGSPEFPGFVATLVEATYLREKLQELSLTNEELKRGIDQEAENSFDNRVSCSGLVWLIPEDRIKGTISELDYRERGGYHRYKHSLCTKIM